MTRSSFIVRVAITLFVLLAVRTTLWYLTAGQGYSATIDLLAAVVDCIAACVVAWCALFRLQNLGWSRIFSIIILVPVLVRLSFVMGIYLESQAWLSALGSAYYAAVGGSGLLAFIFVATLAALPQSKPESKGPGSEVSPQ